MDFSEFEIRYDGSGHPAYHPRIMCKILIQSMLDRVRPSRAIARNVRENIVYMYLAEKLQPDFRTISDFRKENEDLIAEVFKNTVKAAKDLGVIGLEQLSTDGSKVKASASKKYFFCYKWAFSYDNGNSSHILFFSVFNTFFNQGERITFPLNSFLNPTK